MLAPVLPFTLVLVYSQAPPAPLDAGTIYKKAAPAVVLIEACKGTSAKQGSGFLVSPEGKIVTNYHVIAHCREATVRLDNGDAYDTVDVIEIDQRKDIALLKIRAVDLPSLTLGKSSTVNVGDAVVAVTNPLGISDLKNTVSQGIISGIRQGDGFRYFQMSAPISQGSSGGPVFNARGEVIGIATATIELGQNLNFAVPIDYARGMLTTTQTQPLAAIYEPAPPESAPAASAPSGATAPATTAALPEEMRKSSIWFLARRIGSFVEADARALLGEPIRHRYHYDQANNIVGNIFTYPDPTHFMRRFDLSFDSKTKRLTYVYAYPQDGLTWEKCRAVWGDKVDVAKDSDGRRHHYYKDRRLNVYLEKDGRVITLVFY